MMMMEETVFSVRTDGDNDAMLVPAGIETVLVGQSAQRVIVPEGVEVVRLQATKPINHTAGRPNGPTAQRPNGDALRAASRDSLERDSRSRSASSERTAEPAEAARVKRVPAELAAERSLSLPSVPGTPPGASEPEDALDGGRSRVVVHQPKREAAAACQPLVAAKHHGLGHHHHHSATHKWRYEFEHEEHEHRPAGQKVLEVVLVCKFTHAR